MTDVHAQPPSPDSPARTAARPADDSLSDDGIRVDRSPRNLPELRLVDERWPRIAAGILAATTVIGIVFWIRTVSVLLAWCGRGQLSANCVPPAGWVRVSLLTVAIPGILFGIAAAAYLASFAASGRTWRRWRGVTYAFGVLVVAWVITFVVAVIVNA